MSSTALKCTVDRRLEALLMSESHGELGTVQSPKLTQKQVPFEAQGLQRIRSRIVDVALREITGQPKEYHKPIKEDSNGSFRCWNCWELGHSTSACPEARRNWNECERLRQQKGIAVDVKYESQLESAKGKGWFTGEVQILQKAFSSEPQESDAESDDDCTFMYPGLDYSINGFTATVNNNEVDKKPAKETFIQRVSRELKQQGVYPAGGRPNVRRGDPDTLFPEPDERGYLPGVWDPTE
ncbi:hypothetical protein BDD12DRAFT_904123 [Trichophaea hybrida]|nr:hypothetical protein BDD12DRAFT_904123 [Trichophaea hybrida]